MTKPTKKKISKKKFLFVQNSEFYTFTDSQISSADPGLIFKLTVGTYYGLHEQLLSDSLTKNVKIIDNQPIVDYLQSTIAKVEELYPGILSEIRKQSSNFIIHC